MPQDPLFHDDSNRPLYGLRVEITDNAQTLDNTTDIRVMVRPLDGDWQSLVALRLAGRGQDYLATAVEDIVHAWHYEDRRAVVAAAQQNERLARRHARTYDKS